ncbi:MAG: hypothetical protein WCG78_08780, partial [Candidatus Omnitrophota bacterium]
SWWYNGYAYGDWYWHVAPWAEDMYQWWSDTHAMDQATFDAALDTQDVDVSTANSARLYTPIQDKDDPAHFNQHPSLRAFEMEKVVQAVRNNIGDYADTWTKQYYDPYFDTGFDNSSLSADQKTALKYDKYNLLNTTPSTYYFRAHFANNDSVGKGISDTDQFMTTWYTLSKALAAAYYAFDLFHFNKVWSVVHTDLPAVIAQTQTAISNDAIAVFTTQTTRINALASAEALNAYTAWQYSLAQCDKDEMNALRGEITSLERMALDFYMAYQGAMRQQPGMSTYVLPFYILSLIQTPVTYFNVLNLGTLQSYATQFKTLIAAALGAGTAFLTHAMSAAALAAIKALAKGSGETISGADESIAKINLSRMRANQNYTAQITEINATRTALINLATDVKNMALQRVAAAAKASRQLLANGGVMTVTTTQYICSAGTYTQERTVIEVNGATVFDQTVEIDRQLTPGAVNNDSQNMPSNGQPDNPANWIPIETKVTTKKTDLGKGLEEKVLKPIQSASTADKKPLILGAARFNTGLDGDNIGNNGATKGGITIADILSYGSAYSTLTQFTDIIYKLMIGEPVTDPTGAAAVQYPRTRD